MITIQNSCTICLPCGVNDIKNLIITCCDFLFLDCSGGKLIKLCRHSQAVETILLERKYLCLCFDPTENCYWGITECEPHLLYRLNDCFREVGHISIRGAYQQRAISLCCDECGQGVWICYPCQLAFVKKCDGEVIWHQNEDNRKMNLGVLVQCACRVNCFYEGRRQILEVFSPDCREFVELCIPKSNKLAGIASCPCEHQNRICRFYLLLSKGCSNEMVLAEYRIDFSQKPGEHSCPCPPTPAPCPPSPCPPETPCGGNYEVMHSIALEEMGLAHILNAEGEKIQKAVAMSDNIEQLICVNESVKRTMTQVTLLEGMLYSKLEALVSCDNFCHCAKPPCPPPDPPDCCCDCENCHQPNPCE